MRHRVAKKRFSRSTAHRVAMMRNMVTSLIEHERIETTVTKAKELRKLAEKMITLGKKGSLADRRRAAAILRTKESVAKLFSDLAARFKERNGGYTRILKLGFRAGDAAPMAIIEYVDYDPSKKIKLKQAKAEKSEKAAKSKDESSSTSSEVAEKKPAKKTVKAPAKKAAAKTEAKKEKKETVKKEKAAPKKTTKKKEA